MSISLNEEQQSAVIFSDKKPLKIMAGAGTGKTQVLTARYINLIKDKGHDPEKILCLTFTVKAAQEMKRRITDSLKSRGIKIDEAFISNSWISNFHQFCTRLLNENPYLTDYDPESKVINEYDRYNAVKSICQEVLENKQHDKIEVKSQSSFISNVNKIIGNLKNTGVSDKSQKVSRDMVELSYKSFIHDAEILCDDATNKRSKQKYERIISEAKEQVEIEVLYLDLIYQAYVQYEQFLRINKYIDYEDIINFAKKLVEVKPDISERFSYIMVDEFQDTGESQYSLIKALSKAAFSNVTVVGDIKQSIYEWRDARPIIFEKFPGETISLNKNYRSSSQILELAHDFISQSMSNELPLVCGGINSEYNSHLSFYSGEDREEEATYIASEIIELLNDKKTELNDIAILMRSVRNVRSYINVLDEKGIPYKVYGFGGFFEDNIIKDLSAMIRVINDPNDNKSWVRVLQSSVAGYSDKELYQVFLKVGTGKSRHSKPIYEVIDDFDLPKIKPFILGINSIWKAMYKKDFSTQLFKLIVDTGYYSNLYHNDRASISKIYEFMQIITDHFSMTEGANIDSLLDHFELLKDSNLSIEDDSFSGNTVKIMTVHQSKGLEFDNVFVANLKPGSFPLDNKSSLYEYDADYGFFVKSYKNKDTARYSEEIKKTLSAKRTKEERRVLYVAVTRAKKRLYVTTSRLTKKRSVNFWEELLVLSKLEPQKINDNNIEFINDVTSENNIKNIKDKASTLSIYKSSYVSEKEKPMVKLSFSHVAIYDECPVKYKLKYVDKIPLLDQEEEHLSFYSGKKSESSVEVGNIIHKVLQYHHSVAKRGEKSDYKVLEKKVLDLCVSKGLSDNIGCDILKILDQYLSSDYSKRSSFEEEKPFILWLNSDNYYLLLNGKIDRIDKISNGLYEIIDYKTNSKINKNKYRKQLAIYQKAVSLLYGVNNIKSSLFFLRLNEVIDIEFSQNEMQEIMKEIYELAENIVNNNFCKRENSPCKNCEYISFCDKSVI